MGRHRTQANLAKSERTSPLGSCLVERGKPTFMLAIMASQT